MPMFEVTIKERCIRHTIEEIEADDWEQAEDIAQKMYLADKVTFDYTTNDVEFEAEESTL